MWYTVVELLTLNPVVKGSKPTTGTGREKMSKKGILENVTKKILVCSTKMYVLNYEIFSKMPHYNKKKFVAPEERQNTKR